MSAVAVNDQRTQFRSWLGNLLTMADLENMFQRDAQTIVVWIKERQLPEVRIPGSRRDTVRFDPIEVRLWARENDVKVYPFRKEG